MFNSILVVCVGNICRSPVGERLLRQALPELEVTSAGINALVGKPADKTASEVAAAHGLSMHGHEARQRLNFSAHSTPLAKTSLKARRKAIPSSSAPAAKGRSIIASHCTAADIRHCRAAHADRKHDRERPAHLAFAIPHALNASHKTCF